MINLFNVQYTPVLKTFPPIVNHGTSSILASMFELQTSQMIILIIHPKIGSFTSKDQLLLSNLIQLMSQQKDRFKLGVTQVPSSHLLYNRSSLISDDEDLNEIVTIHNNEESHMLNIQHVDNLIDSGIQLVNRYDLIELLGQGGQACVYHGHDHLLNRSVAIKTSKISDRQSTKKQFDQLVREASLAANMQHTNVFKIYDIGFHSNHNFPFIVMEYLIGHDLHEYQNIFGPFTPARLLPLIIPVLEALREAHLTHIVHRDLKSYNLFLINEDSLQEQIRILDFGSAHF